MKKLRWTMDGGFWEVDLSTPATVDGVARPVPGEPLPLGVSRGTRLSRPKQIDFFQRFMAMPLVPSFSDANGLSFQRLLSLPLPFDSWFTSLLGEFNVRKFVTSLRRREDGLKQQSGVDFCRSVWRHLSDPKLYSLNFCSEWLLTPEDMLQLSLEARGNDEETPPRKKAVLHHKLPNHNLTLEASSPALFVDHLGNYWDVPFTLAMDLASVPPDSGTSCHFCINHSSGSPVQVGGEPMSPVPPSLLPGLSAKCAVSIKKNFCTWKSETPKMRKVQPYDMLLSNPHISASAILGSVITASLGDNSIRAHSEDSFELRTKRANSVISADLFASVSLSAQHGNFQKKFLDLTRLYARLDIPSGSEFLSGASRVGLALYNSQEPSAEAVQAMSPLASLSFQQQIAGPFSLRIDAGFSVDMKNEWYLDVNDPVFAVEYALQVLGSAKAMAWYSPRQREFMVELRLFEN